MTDRETMAQCLLQQCLVKPEECIMILNQAVMDPSIGHVQRFEMGCYAILALHQDHFTVATFNSLLLLLCSCNALAF